MFRLFTPHPFTRHSQPRRFQQLRAEELEPRTLLAVLPTTLALSPTQVRQAYGFNQVSFNNGGKAVAADGSGQTIAIVTAYDAPNIFNDVNTFDKAYGVNGGTSLYSQYGTSSSFLTKATPGGLPATDPVGRWKPRSTWNGRTPLPRGPRFYWWKQHRAV